MGFHCTTSKHGQPPLRLRASRLTQWFQNKAEKTLLANKVFFHVPFHKTQVCKVGSINVWNSIPFKKAYTSKIPQSSSVYFPIYAHNHRPFFIKPLTHIGYTLRRRLSVILCQWSHGFGPQEWIDMDSHVSFARLRICAPAVCLKVTGAQRRAGTM